MTNGQTKRGQNRSKGGQGATRRQSPTSPEGIKRLERDLKCVQLRKSRMHWHAITDQLNYAAPGNAYRAFMAVKATSPREAVDTARHIRNDRDEPINQRLAPKGVCSPPSTRHPATRHASPPPRRAYASTLATSHS